jgi:PleD family two-component response regulator
MPLQSLHINLQLMAQPEDLTERVVEESKSPGRISSASGSYFEITDEQSSHEDSENDPVELNAFGKCNCRATVLLVDDQPFNLIPLKMILKERMNIKCDFGEDGEKEVSMFEKNQAKTCCEVRYKLILTDLNMPKMDGFDAAAKIMEY